MSKGKDEPWLTITVRVFNYAQTSPETLKSAQTTATRIFDQMAIEAAWVDCSLSPEGHYTIPVCNLPPHTRDIVLRLVHSCAATRTHFGSDTLGIASRPHNGTPASASVFYDRVEELANGGPASAGVLLGHAVAHEIGHLLLGSDSHASFGLMRGRWSRSDLSLASHGKLLFSERERRAIRLANPGLFKAPEADLKVQICVYN